MVAPSLERSLVNHATLEKSWRLTARRLLGWIRIRTTKTSSSYWLELELDECRDLDDELTVTPIYVFETTNLLRDMYGLRFGKLLADLLFDNKSFAIGALHAALWKAYDTPIRVPMVAGGTDLNPSGETTATPRRRPVREWPAPVPQDGDDFLRRRPADAMTLGWQKFTDPATDREFHYHVASHTSQWLDPRHDYTFAGHDGRATYFWPERAEELRARRRTMGDLELAGSSTSLLQPRRRRPRRLNGSRRRSCRCSDGSRRRRRPRAPRRPSRRGRGRRRQIRALRRSRRRRRRGHADAGKQDPRPWGRSSGFRKVTRPPSLLLLPEAFLAVLHELVELRPVVREELRELGLQAASPRRGS